MSTKKILAENSEKDIVTTAMASPGNEKSDILNYVLDGLQKDFVCNAPPDFRAYADGTYVKRTEN